MFSAYIIRSLKVEKYYIGHAKNLEDRLMAHNSGKVRSTKAYRPWEIVYAESHETKSDAYRRELQIKSYKGGRAFQALIEKSEGC